MINAMINIHSLIAILTISLSFRQCSSQLTQLGLIAQWDQLEFLFPSPEHRHAAIISKKYIAGNSIPIDIDLDYSGKNLQCSVQTKYLM